MNRETEKRIEAIDRLENEFWDRYFLGQYTKEPYPKDIKND